MSGDEPLEDPITAAILGDSHYERLRVGRYALFKQPLSRKLMWHSALLAALALILPITLLFPESTRNLVSSGDLLYSSPKVLLLGVYGGSIVFIGALALIYVGYRRIMANDELSQREACRLLDIEDVASVLCLVTGLFAVLLVDGVFLLGYGGEATMSVFLNAGGENPFVATAIPITVLGVAGAASILAAAIFLVSRLFDRQLSN